MNNPKTKLEHMIYNAIEHHNMLWFYYESSSGNYWRKVDPYILAVKDNGDGNTFFTGYVHSSKERNQQNRNDNQGQYLLSKIDLNRFKVLDETFDKLKLDHDKIFGELPTIEIMCRVDFK